MQPYLRIETQYVARIIGVRPRLTDPNVNRATVIDEYVMGPDEGIINTVWLRNHDNTDPINSKNRTDSNAKIDEVYQESYKIS